MQRQFMAKAVECPGKCSEMSGKRQRQLKATAVECQGKCWIALGRRAVLGLDPPLRVLVDGADQPARRSLMTIRGD